jgi:hypothetical protein
MQLLNNLVFHACFVLLRGANSWAAARAAARIANDATSLDWII